MKKFIISLIALTALVSCGNNNTAKTTATSDVDSVTVNTVADSTDIVISTDTIVLK